MTFLQPYMLWGMLAVAIPVAVHFWYQKKGLTLEWAAMRWLGEQTTLQHKGIRLNEVWLLVLRCLLVLLLALLLSKPIANWFKNNGNAEVVHLVEPDALVTETYRFELEKALQNGEAMYWLGKAPERIRSVSSSPTTSSGLTHLQQQVNALSDGAERTFKLYFRSDDESIGYRKTYIPGPYQLYPAADTSRKKPVSLLEYQHEGQKPIQILLANGNQSERATIRAAFSALWEVYGIVFETEEEPVPAKHYDWVFTNDYPKQPAPGSRYVVSGRLPEWNAPAAVIFLADSLLPGAEMVENGRFPEWLGEMVAKDAGLSPAQVPLSNGQLQGLFEQTNVAQVHQEAALKPWLLLGFVLLLIAERWLALRKTTVRNG